jgi:hypothetical protein
LDGVHFPSNHDALSSCLLENGRLFNGGGGIGDDSPDNWDAAGVFGERPDNQTADDHPNGTIHDCFCVKISHLFPPVGL